MEYVILTLLLKVLIYSCFKLQQSLFWRQIHFFDQIQKTRVIF